MSQFDDMIPQAQDFCARLARENTRDWWMAHKDEYDSRLKAPALALLDVLAPRLEAAFGHPAKPKLFRPQRDVRFSKDKTPYKTHLHMMWALQAGGHQDPALFFGIDSERVTLGVGLMGFDKPVLETWRQMVDLDGDRIAGALDQARAAGFALWEPELKRVPAPFAKDHPHGDLLRHKTLVASREMGAEGDLEAALMQGFDEAQPVVDVLVQIT